MDTWFELVDGGISKFDGSESEVKQEDILNVRLYGNLEKVSIDALVEFLTSNKSILKFRSLSAEHCEFQVFSMSDLISRQDMVSHLIPLEINFVVMPESQRTIEPKLMVFDMDSTLIQMECIDEIARMCGFYDKVSAITERAMRGELDFAESLKERVALLAGLEESQFLSLTKSLPVTEGVVDVVSWAKKNECKIAVVSGGFMPFVSELKSQLGLDYAHANELEVIDKKLTGQVSSKIVDGEEKRSYMLKLREALNLRKEQVWAIGDGANDLSMMSAAGLGVAFHAKPSVVKKASASIRLPKMQDLLFFLEG